MTYCADGGRAIDVDDASLAVARRNLARFPAVSVEKKSAYEVGESGVYDIVFSIGVIHHLQFPERAIEQMVRAAKPGGHVLIWVYGYENNEWIVRFFDPLPRALFSRLPIGLVHHLSLYPTVGLWIALRLGVGRIRYFELLRRLAFAHIRLIVFDQMLPKIAHYWRARRSRRCSARPDWARSSSAGSMRCHGRRSAPNRRRRRYPMLPVDRRLPRNRVMRILLAFAVMIACTVIGNIFMKLGASVPLADRPLFGIVAWQSCAGVAVFVAAVIIYSILLQWMPLNVAQSFAALQFVAVIIASTWFLGEPISLLRWLGIGLIVAGIVAVGMGGGLVEPTATGGSAAESGRHLS
jgi:multidrug transporter EmrE-like cation transporter